jgi:ActR/RegA family two-component response regulator
MARENEAARYRQAAQRALEQLDWCIDYLRREHKTRVARELARNRSAIARRLEERPREGNGDVHRSSSGRE